MSDAPTPETDKAEDSDPIVEGEWKWIVPSSFARRLERERDEARRELSALKAKMEGGSESYSILNTMLEEALRERDEAMRGVEILKRALLKEKAK